MPPDVAEIRALALLFTVFVLTVKFALFLPAETVTLDGTVATEVFPLESVTTFPPEGALPLSVTVPIELLPPLTLVGFSVSEDSVTRNRSRASLSGSPGRCCCRGLQ